MQRGTRDQVRTDIHSGANKNHATHADICNSA
jgi:hypothetical protein